MHKEKLHVRKGCYYGTDISKYFYGRRIKRNMEQTCQELGMNMTTAFTIFAKKMTREKRIPFDVSVDPFYSESNMAHLHRGVEALNNGKGVEYKIIEIDE